MDISPLWVLAVIAAAVLLAGANKKRRQKDGPTSGWAIGPVIRGQNYSPGMPARPTLQGAGWYFDFPEVPSSHVHYVQWLTPPSLVGKKQITIRFTVTGGGFIAQQYPENPALVSLMIQRKGDDWSAKGPMQAYRWFSSKAVRLAEGEFELIVPLEASAWGDVYNGQDPSVFAAALRDVDNVAVLFGSDGGRGHGVYATGPSRFTLQDIHAQ